MTETWAFQDLSVSAVTLDGTLHAPRIDDMVPSADPGPPTVSALPAVAALTASAAIAMAEPSGRLSFGLSAPCYPLPALTICGAHHDLPGSLHI